VYEGDSGEGDAVKITLYPLDYSQYTPAQQMGKVMEELKELELAGDKLDYVVEEAFDVIQALVGYLITLGVDVEAANRRHLEKLERRHGVGANFRIRRSMK
jgi:NTP pyrophosphatase (non-canonical NTP hydrolase)